MTYPYEEVADMIDAVTAPVKQPAAPEEGMRNRADFLDFLEFLVDAIYEESGRGGPVKSAAVSEDGVDVRMVDGTTFRIDVARGRS